MIEHLPEKRAHDTLPFPMRMSKGSSLRRSSPSLLVLALAFGCSSPPTTTAPRSSAPAATVELPPIADDLADLPPDPREPILAEATLELLTKQHVLHRAIDDNLSKEAFPKFVEALDGAKLLLRSTDVDALRRYETRMDDDLRAGNLVLARKGAALVAARRAVVAKVVARLLEKPFTFTAKEDFETDPKKREFARNDEELEKRWRGVLELQVLERIQQMEDILAARDKRDKTDEKLDEAAEKALAAIPATFEAREEKARKELATRYETRFVRDTQIEKLEPYESFINALNAVYDPHTEYLAPAEKANFDIAISGQLQGIGAALGEQDHYVVVDELVPGGASWQQGKLAAGDLILAVAQEGQPAVDVTDMALSKVVGMIRGPKGTVVTLTVKKPDGHIETIAIKRDVIKIEATYARGAVVKLGASGERVGYINLPGFYGDLSGPPKPGDRNATSDVKALLDAFRTKKVNAVVLDLRSNGGGILAHARDITGLFIDKGPVVQTRDTEKRVEVIDDEDPSVAFSGRVVVLVDRFSASAAEILAGALQDYQRAVIVGTGPTHGKGTVQAVVDLDQVVKAGGDPLGIYKITTQEYFRVSGASTQLLGVVPDVVLPDPMAFVESGERTLFHPIPFSTVAAARFQPVAHEWNLAELKTASQARTKANATFSKVEAFSNLLKGRREDTTEPLERTAFQAERKKDKAELEAADPQLKKIKPLLEVEAIPDASTATAAATTDKKLRQKLDAWKEDLARDPWVEEALRIAADMSKKPKAK